MIYKSEKNPMQQEWLNFKVKQTKMGWKKKQWKNRK